MDLTPRKQPIRGLDAGDVDNVPPGGWVWGGIWDAAAVDIAKGSRPGPDALPGIGADAIVSTGGNADSLVVQTGGTGGNVVSTASNGGAFAPTGGAGQVAVSTSGGGEIVSSSSSAGGSGGRGSSSETAPRGGSTATTSARTGGLGGFVFPIGGSRGVSTPTGGSGGGTLASSKGSGGSSSSGPSSRSCDGVVDSSICWKFGAAGASCAQTCGSRGVSPNASKHVGTASQGGSASECGRLFGLLGNSVSIFSVSINIGLGCHMKSGVPNPYAWASSPDYNDGASESDVRIVCGCLY